ncbi:MAG: ribonuclease H [Bacteroidetes bacterium]|nr:MAG: ribonuclease H [Bacteroidota bacterium]
MAKPKPKYYVVWKGKETGIFESWDKCRIQIDGFAGAKYKSFKTKQAAESAFNKSPKDFIGKNTFESELTSEQLGKIGKPILESLSVDAAFDGDVMEYKGVYTKTRLELFKMGPFEGATNNIGEFLAIVHALALLKKQGNGPPTPKRGALYTQVSPLRGDKGGLPVYSDSITAIHWVKTHKANTKLKATSENKSLFYLIQRAEKWLKENKYPNRLLKWETKAWGENPADFGRK